MNVCGRSECQTTGGCAHRGPNGQLCYWPLQGITPETPGWLHVDIRPLSGFSDDEIAAEHYRRQLRKLGDPRIGVSVPVIAN